ncbi:MAG: RDD family protein [Bacilli bacterium]|nr:RDD family protein [Bacilli bacterium]
MKKYIFRILAFIFDLLFVNLVILGLTNISFINPGIKKVQDETTLYFEVAKEYKSLSENIDNILSDNYIDLNESIALNSDYPYFKDIYKDIPVNREIDNNGKEEIKNKIKTYYDQSYATYNYNVNKSNIIINIIGVILTIGYFGVLEWYLKGKTIGKMLFRLRTIDNDKPKRKIPIWKFIVKSLMVSEVMFTIFSIICLLICHPGFDGTLNALWYAKACNLIYDVQYAWNIFLVLIILFRKDERSLHDVLLNIRVALYDKKNKEITKRIFNEEVSDQTN